MNLIKEPITLDRMVGAENTQTIVEEDIVVPDSKPDIGDVLSVQANVNITNKKIENNKLEIEGIVKFKVLYSAEDPEQSLHNITTTAGFNQNLEMEEISEDMDVKTEYDIEHVDYNVMNERKVAVKAIMNLMGKTFKSEEVDVLNDIEGVEDIQTLKNVIEYDNSVGTNTAQTVIRETYELDEETPEIKEFVDKEARAVLSDVKVTDGKVILGGNINLNLVYATEEPRNPIQNIKHEIPFTHFVELPQAKAGMECKTDVKVDEVFTDIKKNIEEQNKVYDVEAVLKSEVEVVDKEEKEVLVDAYSPSRNLNIHKSNLAYQKSAGRNNSQTILKESLDIPTDSPNILKVFEVNGRPIVSDYRLVEDKCVIEGLINTDILYIADNDKMSVHGFSEEIPFRQAVEISGVSPDMTANIKLSIDDIEYSKINSKQVEVRYNINACCEVSKDLEMEVVVDIEDLGEELDEDNRASITIYFVQQGDTLWDIAKRYNTTIQNILEANDIEDPENIKPGDYIIIQKTYEYKF